jgi:CheY-like chemotaxis protein
VTRGASRTARLILLVDDNDINREVAQIVLESAGYRVDAVADGAEAIAAVQDHPYDLVLMDIQMPRIDGITATRRIRALDHPASRVPIVAMTAASMAKQLEEFRLAGMNDHVGKPFKKDGLLAAIERNLAEPAPASQGPAGFDREAYASLLDVMGDEQMRRLLDRLGAQLDACLGEPEAAAANRERLGREVHALVSAAGILGFADLSRASGHLERACLGDGDLPRALVRFQLARQQALHHIAALKQAA